MAPIVVDPEVLAGAGVSVSSVGDEIATAVNTLAAALPNGAMAGHDRAGLAFGQAYQQSAQALMDAAGAAVGGGRKVGFGVQLSATNYSRADASSTIGGAATPLTPPATPGEFDAPSVPSPFGGGVAEPFLWSMVQMFVGDVWPNGDPAQLRAAGTAWSAFGRSMAGIAGQLEGPSATISGRQIPEGGAMASALSDLKQGLADICTESAKLGVQLFEFATDVESAQNAIRDLLSRLSPSGIFDAIGAVFSGDAMEELREIADDIRAVIDNLGRQADARQHALQDVTNLLDGAIVSLQQKARKEFVDFLGEDVGNAVATYFDINTNVLEAPLKVGLESISGLQQLDPLRFAYDFEGAKETWGALGETAFYTNPVGVLTDPIGAFEHGKTMAEGFVHADEWSTDRPGLGPAMAATEIASMVIPGAGVTKATKAADIAGDIAEAGPAVRAAGAVDNAVTDTVSIAGRAEGITEKLDDIGDNLVPNASPDAPGPAIPRDLAEPPRVGEAPPTPTPLAPDAPPAHVPDSAPGDRTPVAPHNSTATEAPRAPVDAGPPIDRTPAAAHSPTPTATSTQAADLPAGSENSAPSTSPSSATPVAAPTHAPETALPTPDSSPPARSDGPGALDNTSHDPPSSDQSTGSAASNGDGGSRSNAAESVGGSADRADGITHSAESDDGSRTYSLMDDSSHRTSFAPEQLLDNQRVSDALDKHGVSKSDFVDLINKPTDSLTPDERHLINAVRDELPAPTWDTVMQKVIPPGHFDDAGNFVQSRADDYIMGNNPRVATDQVGGAVTVADDTAHLSTPKQIYDDLRLDYSDSPFDRHDPGTHIIRFQADPNSDGFYDVPRNSDMGGDGSYDNWDDPFTGNGFTKSGEDVIPEYVAKDLTMRDGAEMWEVLDDGTQRLVAVLVDRVWIPEGI